MKYACFILNIFVDIQATSIRYAKEPLFVIIDLNNKLRFYYGLNTTEDCTWKYNAQFLSYTFSRLIFFWWGWGRGDGGLGRK
jgi:hypothetical protein